MEKLINFLLISGIVINAIIIWLLTKTNKSALPQRILIIFFSCIVFLLLSYYADLNNIEILEILTFIIADSTVILIGPLLYLYVKSLFIEDKNLVKKNLVHFIIPLLYLLLFSIPILIFFLFGIKFYPFIEELVKIDDVYFIIEDSVLILYLILNLLLLNKYNMVTKFIYSNLKNKGLNWVKHMHIGALIVIVVDVFLVLYEFYYSNSNFDSDFVLIILIVLFLYYLGYYGVKQSKILVPDFLINQNNKKKTPPNFLKYNEEEIQLHILNIKDTIINNELFLDEDLTLNKLAKETQFSDKKLSAIINQEMQISFYDLINSYRLAEFKKRIISKKYENLTIIGIAYDCGFKSKSTFNRLFKLKNGLSPSEFKKINA